MDYSSDQLLLPQEQDHTNMPGDSPEGRPKSTRSTRLPSVPTVVDELSSDSESLTSSQERRHGIVPRTTEQTLDTSTSTSVGSSNSHYIMPVVFSTLGENFPEQVHQNGNEYHANGNSHATPRDIEEFLTSSSSSVSDPTSGAPAYPDGAVHLPQRFEYEDMDFRVVDSPVSDPTSGAPAYPVDAMHLSHRFEYEDLDFAVVDSPGPSHSIASDIVAPSLPKTQKHFSTQTDESSLQEAAALKGSEQKGGKWTFMFFWALLQNKVFEGNLAKWVDEPNLIFQVIEGSTKAVSDLWGTLDVSPYHPSWDNLTGRIRYSLKKKEGYFIDFYKDPKFTKLPRKRCFRFTKHVQELIGTGRINEGQFRRIKESLDKRSSTQNGNGSRIAE